MNSRVTVTIVLAVVLMVLVMGVAALFTFTQPASSGTWAVNETWAQPDAGVINMKVTNMTGAGKTDLFVQAGNHVQVFDASGKQVLSQELPGTLAAVLGDVDGDSTPEIVAYYATDQGSTITAFKATESSRVLWKTNVQELGPSDRVAVVDFDGKGKVGVVIGDQTGRLVAVSDKGQERWHYDLQLTSAELRGLDNILSNQGQLVAAAGREGKVVALDRSGKEAWTFAVPAGLRRLRTEELMGPGQSAVLLGSEDGTLYALDGSTGKTLWTASVGQAITEIRMAELDGDPGTRELVVGGKNNGVWGYSQSGARLFSASIGGAKTKVTEIAALSMGETGKDVVAIGDETGVVTFFDAKGRRLVTRSYAAPINRMTTGKFGGQWQFIVADGAQVRAMELSVSGGGRSLLWASPLLGGLVACAIIAGVAYLIASMKPAPALQLSAEQMTVEAQKARRIMLHEAINDLRRMKQAGEVPPEAYLARLKDLRAQLADAEANLIKLGVPLTVETIACPHCGGRLELGTDRCEYCGQTVLT